MSDKLNHEALIEACEYIAKFTGSCPEEIDEKIMNTRMILCDIEKQHFERLS